MLIPNTLYSVLGGNVEEEQRSARPHRSRQAYHRHPRAYRLAGHRRGDRARRHNRLCGVHQSVRSIRPILPRQLRPCNRAVRSHDVHDEGRSRAAHILGGEGHGVRYPKPAVRGYSDGCGRTRGRSSRSPGDADGRWHRRRHEHARYGLCLPRSNARRLGEDGQSSRGGDHGRKTRSRRRPRKYSRRSRHRYGAVRTR